jgi:hypothetical protein
LNPYAKLERWLSAAKKSPGFREHGYYPSAQLLINDMRTLGEEIQGIMTGNPAICLYLQKKLAARKSGVAIALLWFIILPDLYEPPAPDAEGKAKTFSEWQWPPLELEFDHGGDFRWTGEARVHYEGGETKSFSNGYSEILDRMLTVIATKEARKQLERRFYLVDGVLTFGYGIQEVSYTAKVYTPYLLSGAKKIQMKDIIFCRPAGATGALLGTVEQSDDHKSLSDDLNAHRDLLRAIAVKQTYRLELHTQNLRVWK